MMKRTVPATMGLWSIDGDTLVRVDGWDVGPTIVAVPSEAVPTIVVDRPAGRAPRRAALTSAIEQRIAGSIEAVHVAIGSTIAPNAVLVATVDHAVMQRWLAVVDAAGLDHAVIVPDAMLLPMPATGAWTIAIAGGRVRVRADDGGGFAVAEANFVAAWTQGGQLPCDVVGDARPLDLPANALRHAAAAPASITPIDLRQGPYAVPGRTTAYGRRLGLILAGGLLAHTAIAAADTIKLQRLAEGQRHARPSAARHLDFLPLMNQVSVAVSGQQRIDLVGLTFVGDRLTLRVAGPPAPVRAALRSHGLDTVVVAGAAA